MKLPFFHCNGHLQKQNTNTSEVRYIYVQAERITKIEQEQQQLQQTRKEPVRRKRVSLK